MMNYNEHRDGRRVPVGCSATVRLLATNTSFCGTCHDISVHGMCLHTNVMPHRDEELEVTVIPPLMETGVLAEPLAVRAQVKRCRVVEPDMRYELGVEIVSVLSTAKTTDHDSEAISLS